MTARWVVAGLGVAVLAVVSVSLMTGRREPAAGTAAGAGTAPSHASATVCDGEATPARLDFTLTDMDYRSVDLSQYQGRPVLLNFWATWCGPCKIEIPILIELQKKYEDRGFVVLGVSADDPVDALKSFATALGMNYPVLAANEAILDAYGPIWAIPVSFFIKKDGTLCKKHMGPALSVDQFEEDIKALL